jgi:heat shock protein HtpX
VALDVILPLERAAENRRRARALLAVLALAALPSVAYVGQYLAFVFLLWMVPVFAGLGWVAFFALDALLVVGLLLAAFAWVYRSARRSLLGSIKAMPVSENDDSELRRASENMAIAAGLPPPSLYLVADARPNLLAIGLHPDDTALVATTGLLDLLDRRELEAAVAHLTAQVVNGDTRLDTLLAAGIRWLRLPGTLLARAFTGLARFAGRFGVAGWGCFLGTCLWLGIPMLLSVIWGFQDPDIRPLAVIAAAFLIYVFAGAPIVATLLSRFVMRERKQEADADAVQLTRYPVALVRALAKVDAAGSGYADARPETANLHFADPFPDRSSWLARILDSHPPAAERLAMVSRLGAPVPPSEAEEAAELGRAYAAVTPAIEPESAPAPPDLTALDAREPSPLNLVRLLDDAPLLSTPEPSATARGTVAAGTRVTVLAEQDGFLEVVTPADEFGFLAPGVRFTELATPRLSAG